MNQQMTIAQQKAYIKAKVAAADALYGEGARICSSRWVKIHALVAELQAEPKSNQVKRMVYGSKAIVEVFKVSGGFYARYRAVDRQLGELVTVDFVRGSKDVVRAAFVKYQAQALAL